MAAVYDLRGRAALVTGAASGIGAETARRMAQRGAKVALLGLDPERLEQVAAACGSDAMWAEVDVTDTASLEQAVSAAVERYGGLDVVIANAGIAATGTVRTIDPEAWERTVEVNLLGTWRTVRATLDHVIARRGYILNVASIAAAVHPPGASAYAASKAGIEAFSDSLRVEVAHLGVDVGVAYFSWIATELVSEADEHPGFAYFRSTLKGPLVKTHPLSAAVDAVMDGIERRARRVVAPRWVRAMLTQRDLAQRVAERDARAHGAEIVRITEAEVEAKGAAAASMVTRRPLRAGESSRRP